MAEAVRQAHAALARRQAYATALVVRIDKHTDTLQYINAGHLPMIQCTKSDILWHRDLHRTWLGLDHATPLQPTTVPFADGDELVIFTDGLIEERGEIIDTSLNRLVTQLHPGMPLQNMVDHIIADRVEKRTQQTVDDDIAIVAIRRDHNAP